QTTMQEDVGALRSRAGLERALSQIDRLTTAIGERSAGDANGFDMRGLEWLDLRNMLLVARTVAEVAISRTERRGAHQREDYPETMQEWSFNQVACLHDRRISLSRLAVPKSGASTAND